MSLPRNEPATAADERLRKLRTFAPIIAIVATALCVVGAMADVDRFLQSYLVAWIFTLSLSMGALATLLLHRLTGGLWGAAIARSAERASALVPLLALAFIPIALELPRLYPWARPDVVSADEILQEKAIYLNRDSFLLRAAGYFVLWSLLAIVLRGPRRWRLPGNVSALGLAAYFLSTTFAAVDWIMSLEPHWYSSTFGAMFVVGQGLSGLSVSVLGYVAFSAAPGVGATALKVLRDLNNLVLAFVMLWAYIAFTQFLIIYYGNIAEEVVWYVERIKGGWQWIAVALIALHFGAPFLALVAGSGKDNPRALGWICAAILLVHWFDIHWLIVPAFSPGRLQLSWIDAATTIAMLGWWLAAWSWQGAPFDRAAEAKI